MRTLYVYLRYRFMNANSRLFFSQPDCCLLKWNKSLIRNTIFLMLFHSIAAGFILHPTSFLRLNSYVASFLFILQQNQSCVMLNFGWGKSWVSILFCEQIFNFELKSESNEQWLSHLECTHTSHTYTVCIYGRSCVTCNRERILFSV